MQIPAIGNAYSGWLRRNRRSRWTGNAIKVLLLERLSLRGICRVTGVSLTWLLHFITELYCALPDDPNVTLSQARKSAIRLVRLEAEADEIWSFAVSLR